MKPNNNTIVRNILALGLVTGLMVVGLPTMALGEVGGGNPGDGLPGGELDDATPAEEALLELYPEIEASSEITGEALIDGAVVDPAGEPLEDVVVTLEAWPQGSNVKDIAIGEAIPVSIVAKALTDENGEFELKLEDTGVLDEYADSGSVEFQVVTHAEDGEHAQGFSGLIDDSGDTVVLLDSTLEGPIETEIEEPAAVTDLLAEEEALNPKFCAWVKIGTYAKRDATITQIYSTASYVNTDFSYSKDQATTVGIGVNVGTSAVQFKASGTASVKTGSTVTFNTKKGVHSTGYRMSARYYKAQKYCYSTSLARGRGEPPTKYKEYRAMPIDLTGGWSVALSVSAPATKANNCDTFERVVTADRGSSVTWTNGIAFKDAIGTDLSTKISFSKGIKVTFTSPTGKRYKVCGTTNYPQSGNPGLYVARPYP